MPLRIFITGCAKSGTTLLQNLFYSFENVTVIPGEHRMSEFFHLREIFMEDLVYTKPIIVIKRVPRSIFSNIITRHRRKQQSVIIQENDLKVVNIFRDGRDVVYRDNENVTFQQNEFIYGRWIESIRMMKELSHLITFNLKYEDLTKYPDREQQKIANILNLVIKHKFSEYPIFVPNRDFDGVKNPSYKKRPIMTDKIGKNLNAYKKFCPPGIIKKFEMELKSLSYI